jgi:hypothetical protein
MVAIVCGCLSRGNETGPKYITEDTTWSGRVEISRITIVESGVTLTIAAGSTVAIFNQAELTIEGEIVVNGTASQPVRFEGMPIVSLWVGGNANIAHTDLREIHASIRTGSILRSKTSKLNVMGNVNISWSNLAEITLTSTNANAQVSNCRVGKIGSPTVITTSSAVSQSHFYLAPDAGIVVGNMDTRNNWWNTTAGSSIASSITATTKLYEPWRASAPELYDFPW